MASQTAGAPRRYAYLDGLRGLAALYVVLHHTYFEINFRADGGGLPKPVIHVMKWAQYGHYAVAVFIVLSGFCLMLPVAQSRTRHLRGGVGEYLKRRARRILPPYYAALALSLLLVACVPAMHTVYGGLRWDDAQPVFNRGVLLSHLGLFHNVSKNWAYKIDPPMWSIATEWQIYFLFPALLLPVWRRFGMLPAILMAFAGGIGLLYLPHGVHWVQACPWYFGLFALGACGAWLVAEHDEGARRWGPRIGAPAMTRGIWLLLIPLIYWLDNMPMFTTRVWVADVLVGLAALSLLVRCGRAANSAALQLRAPLDAPGEDATPVLTAPPDRSRALALLQSPIAVWLGAISYSLYLVHYPLLSLLHAGLRGLGCSPAVCLAGLFGIGVPFCLVAAVLFHIAFERRFVGAPAARPVVAPAVAVIQ